MVYAVLLIYAIILRWIVPVHGAPDSGGVRVHQELLLPILMGGNYSHAIWGTGWLAQIITLILTLAGAFFFNYSMRLHNMFPRGTHIPALIYITLSSAFAPWIPLSWVLFCGSLALAAMHLWLRLASEERLKERIFFGGLLSGLAALIYVPATVLVLPYFFAILMQTYSLYAFLLALIALLTPAYFIGIYAWHHNTLDAFKAQAIIAFDLRPEMPSGVSAGDWMLLGLIVILSLMGYIVLAREVGEFKILKLRRQFLVFVIMGLSIGFGGAWLGAGLLGYLYLLVIPASVYISALFFRDHQPWYIDGLFYVLLSSILVLRIAG